MLLISVQDASAQFSFEVEPSPEDHKHKEAYLSALHDRYKDQISALPKVEAGRNGMLSLYQGFWYPSSNQGYSVETMMALQDTWKARSTDVYVVTQPKSGTTWTKALVFAIVNRTMYRNESLSNHPLLKFNPHICVPFIEAEFSRNTPTHIDTHSPRIFGTHMPYTTLPRSIIDLGCRIVYMCRNPKDVVVSWLNFMNKYTDTSNGLVTIEEMFEMFSQRKYPYGPYWDQVKGFHKASLENPTKILFLTYENMKMDTATHVKRLAEFLACPFTEEEEAEEAVEAVVRLCSIESLREVNKNGNYMDGVPNHAFFGEGKVGGWRNHLTTEMSQILDDITSEKFQGLDIYLD